LSLRSTILVSALLFLAHAVVLATWGHEKPGPVVSGFLQLGLGIVCMAAAVSASRGATGFERRFLLLVGARYAIFTAAQAVATWYELHFYTGWTFEGSPADVLFHLEDLPLGVAFFLDPGPENTRLERPRVLDLLQIAVFWSAVVIYGRFLIVDVPVGVGLVATTDGLVAGCFYLRAMTSRSAIASALFGRWTPAILLSTVNDAYSGFYNSNGGEAFDLIWTTESLVWIITAATWRPMAGEAETGVRRVVDRTVSLLPLVVACFSVVLSLGIAQRRMGMAAALVLAAVVCSVGRLFGRRAAPVSSAGGS
jgi:hypothetical protein